MSQFTKTVSVFYRPELLATSASFSPSAAKPRPVVEDWLAARLPVTLCSFEPVTKNDLVLAHDAAYVQGVLAGKIPNGFGNVSAEVARSLPYTTGAMLAAAREALRSGVACAPVSGFHHARYDTGGGYCTFNGLMVTALRMLADGRVGRVLILDCDQHYGDGTEQIRDKLGVTDSIAHHTLGFYYHRPAQARAYLSHLEGVLDNLQPYDLMLYQAGADVHADDPLGGVLSSDQMRQRDEMVFAATQRHGVPVAWNLAGGYQEPLENVIALHRQTMEACADLYVASRSERGEKPARIGY